MACHRGDGNEANFRRISAEHRVQRVLQILLGLNSSGNLSTLDRNSNFVSRN
jgi:hypothetical protein